MNEQNEQDERYVVAKRRVEAKKTFLVHLAVYVVVNAIFLVIVGRDFLWATVFWGLGLLGHAAATFLRESRWLRDWEQRAIQRELARLDRKPRRTPEPVATATAPETPTAPIPAAGEPTEPGGPPPG